MFAKILVANRGEIAVRIIRACKEMGIATVAVYSQADSDSLHVALADESYCIGHAEASDSYLNAERIVSAALSSGVKAIHPGYGFLSENAEFAELCYRNGIVFIGPAAESMRAVSDKEGLKRRMAAAGLPIIPGSSVIDSVGAAREAADKIGYPVMLKARSGGGGRGIRLVSDFSQMESSYHSAAAEAKSAFQDESLYMERYIYPAKHIEIQILADEQGHVICLGERDCSMQRRNQKLIEESPAPTVPEALREKIIGLSIDAVKKLKYVGVGTLEFLFDGKEFFFMEMNVRLQVEHTVTEMLTRLDLVKWQIRVAAGIPLSFTQDQIHMRGCSIECRINALAPGTVRSIHIPGGPFVRFDTYIAPNTVITPYYDSLLGKLIVCAGTRDEALRKMRAALCELVIDGVPTNVEEQLDTVESEAFESGSYDLGFWGR